MNQKTNKIKLKWPSHSLIDIFSVLLLLAPPRTGSIFHPKNIKTKEQQQQHHPNTDHNKSSGANVKCILTTTQRRGAICIIVNNPDEDSHYSKTNAITSNGATEHCDIDIDDEDDVDDSDDEDDYEDGVDDDDDGIEYTNDDGNAADQEVYTNDSANDNNNIDSTEKMLRKTLKNKKNAKVKSKKKKAAAATTTTGTTSTTTKTPTTKKKKKKKAKISMETTIIRTANSSFDAQVQPKKYNFWHNLLVTQKNGKSTRFIDYFRHGNRDIHRKSGEG